MGFLPILVCFVLTVFVTKVCECKPAPYNGYPEENRNVYGPYSADLFEGDILVTPEIKKIALTGGDVSMATTRKRGASALDIWANGVIPYEIASSLSDNVTAITNGMREWEKGTCLSFVPFDKTVHDVYLKIISSFHGCFGVVGSVDVSRYPKFALPTNTFINLGAGCLTPRVIIHELGHAIGFWHEQSRPDRDSHINILYENIQPGKAGEFAKYPNSMIDSLGFPYDLKSVMHYGPKTFTVSANRNTIETVDPSETLETNDNISVIDRQQLNKLYSCPQILTLG